MQGGSPCTQGPASLPSPFGEQLRTPGSQRGAEDPRAAGIQLLALAHTAPSSPPCARLPSPCSGRGAANTFFCSALPRPGRAGAAYLRNRLAK